ncbi:hypothetical protein EV359DRAFT_68887 [Lentinula novae-zelandiae]|nr:hypothetical protein EV359DRAFT_68887 [Lentinula novae-zelandiae]
MFSTAFFVQLTGLNSAIAKSRRVKVPVAMIAVATNNVNKVINLYQLIGPCPHRIFTQNPNVALEAPGSRSSLELPPTKQKQMKMSCMDVKTEADMEKDNREGQA